MEQCRNERAGETGDPRHNPPTSGNVLTILTCQNPGVTQPGIEPELIILFGSTKQEQEATDIKQVDFRSAHLIVNSLYTAHPFANRPWEDLELTLCLIQYYVSGARVPNVWAATRKDPGSIPRPAILIAVFRGFPKTLQGEFCDGSQTKAMTDSFPILPPIPLPCATCTVPNDLAVDETCAGSLIETPANTVSRHTYERRRSQLSFQDIPPPRAIKALLSLEITSKVGLHLDRQCSTDLTNMDFFLWSYINSLVYEIPMDSEITPIEQNTSCCRSHSDCSRCSSNDWRKCAPLSNPSPTSAHPTSPSSAALLTPDEQLRRPLSACSVEHRAAVPRPVHHQLPHLLRHRRPGVIVALVVQVEGRYTVPGDFHLRQAIRAHVHFQVRLPRRCVAPHGLAHAPPVAGLDAVPLRSRVGVVEGVPRRGSTPTCLPLRPSTSPAGRTARRCSPVPPAAVPRSHILCEVPGAQDLPQRVLLVGICTGHVVRVQSWSLPPGHVRGVPCTSAAAYFLGELVAGVERCLVACIEADVDERHAVLAELEDYMQVLVLASSCLEYRCAASTCPCWQILRVLSFPPPLVKALAILHAALDLLMSADREVPLCTVVRGELFTLREIGRHFQMRSGIELAIPLSPCDPLANATSSTPVETDSCRDRLLLRPTPVEIDSCRDRLLSTLTPWSDYSPPPIEIVSLHCGITPGFSHVGIVRVDADCLRAFSGISHFPRLSILALLHAYVTSPSSSLKTSMLSAAQISPPPI
ncbi:hypothetical protein PR048_001901 [Dryococelus australis]|uniref:Uncharacterized protein n=1 Tax=Dryococelus australis TaxID=614101 RepID=A0ABQ9IJC9_9NEOP|nr:hypothetical protein PR048_001901 [Dryococelus australis]